MTLRRMRWVNIGIGSLVMIMMLGTALFSLQAFNVVFQLSAPKYLKDGSIAADTESTAQAQDTKAPTSDSSAAEERSAHSMDSRPEEKGFLTVPWIPVSYIRQATRETSLTKQDKRFLREFIRWDYPSDHTVNLTDRTVRNRSNAACRIQVLTLHVSKLTAG